MKMTLILSLHLLENMGNDPIPSPQWLSWSMFSLPQVSAEPVFCKVSSMREDMDILEPCFGCSHSLPLYSLHSSFLRRVPPCKALS